MLLSDDRVSDRLCLDVGLRQHRRVWRSRGADSGAAAPMMRSRSYLGPSLGAGPLSLLAWFRFNLLHLQGRLVRSDAGPRGRGQRSGWAEANHTGCVLRFYRRRSVFSEELRPWKMTRTSSASRLFKAHYLLTVCRFEGRRSISRPHRTSCAIHRLFQTRGYHAAAMKVRFQVMLNLGNGGGGGSGSGGETSERHGGAALC